MKVRIELDPSQDEVEIIIKTKEVTDEIQQILKIIEGGNVNQIVGVLNQQYYLLNLNDIYWFYTEERKVMAQTKKGRLEVKA
ncbi:LytTR family DNA-binding domain-containing protein, partial [Bacillus cereus group sp. Bce025]